MMGFVRFAAVAAAVLAVSATATVAHDEKAEPPVQYRMAVMHGMGENASAIGLILRAKLPQRQNLGLHAEIIARSARAALSAFEPKVAGGAAKPEVWDKWQDFSDRLKQLAAGADELATIADTQGPDAAAAKAGPLLGQCKSCHDIYKRK
jgi:cytochrome c556